jgi:hypothetical protein
MGLLEIQMRMKNENLANGNKKKMVAFARRQTLPHDIKLSFTLLVELVLCDAYGK